MAEVWVATDTDLDRKVAVKWLKTNLAADPVVAERFRREAIAVARLSHPNIVAIHDVFIHDGRQAVVMQLVDGKSLRQLLDSQKRLGPELTIHIGAAIAGALDEAHRAGFVHRDVKPGNILVTSDGRVLLTDFGIAKGLEQGDEDLTSDNVMMGTAKYLSPEQVRGRTLDGRADLYSLALVMYECLAGRVPFLGQSDADTALARLQRDPTDLGNLRPTVPIGLVNLIHRTLARNPAHRPQTGAELRSALLAVDTEPPPIDKTPADPPLRAAEPAPGSAVPFVPGDPHLNAANAIARHSAEARKAPPAPRRSPLLPRSKAVAAVATPPTPASSRDDTPAAVTPMRGAPAKQDQQRWAPSLVVVTVLIVGALIVAGVLFVGLNRGDESAEFTGDTVLPETTGGAGPDAEATGEAQSVTPGSPVDIVAITTLDPFGDNGTENDGQVDQARADGSSSTAWPTECYSDPFMNGKGGVGLVVTLSAAGTGTLSFDSLNAPYQVDVYAFDGVTPPAEPDGWSKLGDTRTGQDPGTIEVPVATPATHLLVWLRELGPDEVCTDANPYRGRLDEIAFRP
jgi:serine/threonine protein kinase